MGSALVCCFTNMSNIEFLSDAQSEMVAGGAYLGTSANWVALSNIGAATAVGGSPQTLLGVGGGGARATTTQRNTSNLTNVILSLF
jgi:hypothetical protein